jgi:hypothetical protein
VSDERGQALVEVIAGLPLVLAVAAVLLQLLATGYSAVLAGGAAEAGALAVANHSGAREAVRSALPGWSEASARLHVSDGTVTVTLRPPSPLSFVSRQLEVAREAEVVLP